jgi:hypothetical protein
MPSLPFRSHLRLSDLQRVAGRIFLINEVRRLREVHGVMHVSILETQVNRVGAGLDLRLPRCPADKSPILVDCLTTTGTCGCCRAGTAGQMS